MVPRVLRLMFWVGLAGVAAVVEACGGETNEPRLPTGPGGNAGAGGRAAAGQAGGPSAGGAPSGGGGTTASGGTAPTDAGLWDVIYE